MSLHRENTISELLQVLLDDYPAVHLTGIGTFEIACQPAWVDPDSYEFYPPIKSLRLHAKEGEVLDFVVGIRDILALSPAHVDEIEAQVISHVLEIQRQGSTTIDGIGNLSLDDHNSVVLSDVHVQWQGATAYLPVLQLYPSTPPLRSDGADTQLPPPTRVAGQKSEWPKAFVPANKGNIWKGSILPILVLVLGIFGLWWLLANRGDKANTHQDLDAVSTYKDSSYQRLYVNEAYQHLLTEEILNEGCLIVVGSFANHTNASQRLQEINNMGYETIIVPYQESFRVTIKFDCTLHNLKSYLLYIQSELHANAWYLSPQVDQEDL